MRISLSARLIITFLSISVLSIIVVGNYSYFEAKDALIDRTLEQLISIRVEKENRVIDFFNQRTNDISNISNHIDAKTIFNELNSIDNNRFNGLFDRYLLGYLRASKCYKRILFISPESKIVVYDLTNDTLINTDKSKVKTNYDSYFNGVNNKETIIINESLIDPENYSIEIGLRMYNSTGALQGTMFLEISYQQIDQIMFENREYNGLGKTGETYIVGKDHLMRSSSRFQTDAIFKTSVKTMAVDNSINNISEPNIIKDYRGVDVFSSYKKSTIGGLNWIFIAEIDKSEAMTSINSLQNNIIYLSFIVSLLLLGIVAVLSVNITAPIRKLQAATELIYKGEYGKTIKINARNEIGDLINAFNKMSVQLKEQTERIEFEQVKRMSSVISGQEAERQRLSRELHDGLAQHILSIKLRLEHALSVQGNKRKQLISETKELFSETIKEIRDISNNLTPAVLNQYGLIKAIQNLSNNINNDSKLEFNFVYNTSCDSYGKKIDSYIYRIIQEALNNTIKHSKASLFSVNISEVENNINIKISDNGTGFDQKSKTIKNGNGLVNINERVSLLSGNLSINSENGTTLTITIPI